MLPRKHCIGPLPESVKRLLLSATTVAALPLVAMRVGATVATSTALVPNGCAGGIFRGGEVHLPAASELPVCAPRAELSRRSCRASPRRERHNGSGGAQINASMCVWIGAGRLCQSRSRAVDMCWGRGDSRCQHHCRRCNIISNIYCGD